MPFPSSPLFTPSFQIIVVPPAEDFQPEYLVFDAEDQEHPNFASLDDALTRIAPPAFNRASVDAVVMPRRSGGESSSTRDDVADETVRDDSEIVEVVKVRRALAQEAPPLQQQQRKSTSLRSRASRAFRSIKNVARSSSRSSTPYAQDVFASSQSTQATFATAPPPPLARRGSMILTQLFRAPSPAEVPTSATLDFLPSSERYSDEDFDEDYDDDDDDDNDRESIVPRAPSPSPSARTFSSTVRRRLSIFNFQRNVRTPAPLTRPASPPPLSRGSTVPSTSSSAPQTPTEESYPLPPPPQIAKDADDTVGEMRLDSLHFEALSFDADNF